MEELLQSIFMLKRTLRGSCLSSTILKTSIGYAEFVDPDSKLQIMTQLIS